MIANLRDTITYWAPTGESVEGKTTWASPIQYKARYEEKTEIVKDAQGKDVNSKARVYLEDNVALGGYIFNGKSKETNPTTVSGAYEIISKGRTSDLRRMRTLTMVML